MNSLRNKGNTRPLSILQVCSEVRAKYAHMKLVRLAGMLIPFCKLHIIASCCKLRLLLIFQMILMEMLLVKYQPSCTQYITDGGKKKVLLIKLFSYD